MSSVWAVEYVVNDPLVRPYNRTARGDLIQAAVDSLTKVHAKLKFGGENNQANVGQNPFQDNILYNSSCTTFPACRGLDSMVAQIAKQGISLSLRTNLTSISSTEMTIMNSLTNPGVGAFDNLTTASTTSLRST
eukprot:TRINITY_DN7920_c0_g1_i2.p1 TRINITY_DN7920_c0_g1~~TRINITY_DN7920_c0_g1_i2.p1  ORF type:complete len:134 (-),score=27.55 TRINITY_DN7920_c0_g1_i2:570-971(-)